MTGVLQNFARAAQLAIDKLMWNFEVLKEAITNPDPPEKGAYIYGNFMEGARWDDDNGYLADSFPKVRFFSCLGFFGGKGGEKGFDKAILGNYRKQLFHFLILPILLILTNFKSP